MFAKFCLGLLMAAVVAVLAPAAWAQDKTHDGKVVSVGDGKLVMTDKAGQNEHTHVVPATAKVTVDGKASALLQLKKGDAVVVTTDAGGKVLAVAVSRPAKG